jgi:hypothetical protein
MSEHSRNRGFMQVKPGGVVEVLNKQQCGCIRQTWKKQFATRGQGMRLSQHLWHVFSHEGYPALSGDTAERAYMAEQAVHYVVMDDQMTAGLITDLRPDNLVYQDVHVFPLNLAWTMAFTHEDGCLGPYFARHQNHHQLSAENASQLEKQAQIQQARENGWL